MAAFHNATGAISGIDQDGDGIPTRMEYTADTNPNDPASLFRIQSISANSTTVVYFLSSAIRVYSFEYATNLLSGGWTPFPGQTNDPGTGGLDSFTDPSGADRYYRLRVFGP
jgi:hypothetical protein